VPTTRSPLAPSLWRDPRHRRGLAGERAAIRFLEARGWQVEAHRFRFGHHDLDLIIRRGSLVAFVEVKSRASLSFGAPVTAVGWRKRQVLAKVAVVWMLRSGRLGDQYRFDLVAVTWTGAGFPQIDHIEDAWRLVDK